MPPNPPCSCELAQHANTERRVIRMLTSSLLFLKAKAYMKQDYISPGAPAPN